MKYHEKAGMLLKVVTWIQLAALLPVSFFLIKNIHSLSGWEEFGIVVIAAAMWAVLPVQMVIGWAIGRQKLWGQICGIIVGLLYLFSFPVCTPIGGLLLYWLIAGLKKSPASSPSN